MFTCALYCFLKFLKQILGIIQFEPSVATVDRECDTPVVFAGVYSHSGFSFNRT